MKRYTFEEKRIYIAEISFDAHLNEAYNVHKSFIKKFPEYKGSQYEYIYTPEGESLIKVFTKSCFDFIEK